MSGKGGRHDPQSKAASESSPTGASAAADGRLDALAVLGQPAGLSSPLEPSLTDPAASVQSTTRWRASAAHARRYNGIPGRLHRRPQPTRSCLRAEVARIIFLDTTKRTPPTTGSGRSRASRTACPGSGARLVTRPPTPCSSLPPWRGGSTSARRPAVLRRLGLPPVHHRHDLPGSRPHAE